MPTDPRPENSTLQVTRQPVRLAADARRVLARPFLPGGAARIRAVFDRVLALSDAEVSSMVSALVFSDYCALPERNA